MPSVQDDYLLRMIRQAVIFMQRILKLRGEGRLEEARDDLDDAWDQLLGLPRHVAAGIDAPSLMRILATPDRASVAADLLDLEASFAEADGKAADAERCREKARYLRVR